MYDEILASRVRNTFNERTDILEKKMFGGLTFMVDGKMCVGVIKSELMVRFDPKEHEEILEKQGVRQMDFTRMMPKGFVMVSQNVIVEDHDLISWIDLALRYNQIAKKRK
jgi:TfoX/Sxy family transcriptional regulator of competence genes